MRRLVELFDKFWESLFFSSGLWLISFRPTGTSGKQRSGEDPMLSLGKLLGKAESALEFGDEERFEGTMKNIDSLITELKPDPSLHEKLVGSVEDFLVQMRGEQHASTWLKNLSNPTKKNP